MLKLQVVLVPPSAQNGPAPYGFSSSTTDTSRLLASGSVFGSAVPRNPDTSLPFPSNISAANTTLYPNHFAQTKRRKFLHFTKSSNTLLDLSLEIVQKCEKMYPTITEEIDILSLQDNSGCDLDPDFYVKDVFNIDNTVRVILKNEMDLDESSPVSGYRSMKKKRLNSGFAQPQEVQSQSAQTIPPASSASGNGGILKIAKKRPSASTIRNPTTATMRISTPLAHQIYPPPSSNRLVSNNSDDEEEDVGEKSFLPPPAQPQSPPIRVSSSMENNKRIRSSVEEDAVSRSETVDPDKTKQQRLLSGTPLRNTMTPNRVTLTGQRVVSERMSNGGSQNGSIFSASSVSGNRQGSAANTRITSGMLSIPEPRISEIEKELKEGPSSPASVLPPVPDRIPMKEPYQKIAVDQSDDISSSDEQESDSQVKSSAQRQTSIADNNGSPVKESPLGDSHLRNVHLAELPESKSPSALTAQRKTSLEARVENKSLSVPSQRGDEEEPIRKENFSDEENEEDQNAAEDDQGLQQQLGIAKKGPEAVESDQEEENEGNDTVLITRNEVESKSSANTSIHKTDFLKLMEGGSGSSAPWLGPQGSKGKPYTTVLHKDIDNSKPDPRNIIPRDTPRSAARKAAHLLSGRPEEKPEPYNNSSASENSSSSDIETDSSLDSDHDRILINENNSLKSLNLRPLKEKVVSGQEPNAVDTSDEHYKPSKESTSGTASLNGSKETADAQINQGEPSNESLLANQHKNNLLPTKLGKDELGTETDENNSKGSNNVKVDSKLHHEPSSVHQQPPPKKHDSSTNEKEEVASDHLITGKGSGETSDGHQHTAPSTHTSKKNALNHEDKSPHAARSQLTKKEEAEIKRKEREAARAAKLEAAQKLKAEKEAQKIAKQKAREEAKKAREAEAAKKKFEREEKKRLRQEKLEEEKRKRQEANAKKGEESTAKKDEDKMEAKMEKTAPVTKLGKVKDSNAILDGSDKLKELKAKFTKSRAYVPAGLVPQKIKRSEDSSESESSDDDSSSDDSSSSDEESSPISKKARRLIVDTPKGSLNSAQTKRAVKELPGVEDVPQSTQRSNPASQETPARTPNKVPVTRLMELSSPSSSSGDAPSRPSFLQGLPQKVRPSLSSLSDLVSKGVPDVREKSLTASQSGRNNLAQKVSDDSEDEDDSVSESSDSDSDSGSDASSTDGGSFISAKSASTALGKKKRGGGFASLLKDSRKT